MCAQKWCYRCKNRGVIQVADETDVNEMEQERGEEEETKIDQETVFVPEVSDLSQTTTTFSMPTNSERGPSCQAETVDV